MKTIQKLFFVLTLFAFVLVAALPSASAAAAKPTPTPKPKEIAVKLASVSKVALVSTAPYSATIRVTGTYTCDKVRIEPRVSGKIIYIEVWDTKNRGNDCTGNSGYSRTFEFKPLVPGKYTVYVNSNPETGKPAKQLKNVIVPVGATPTPATP
jgi:hypothetical protein